MGLDTKTYWLTDRQSQCDFDFDFDRIRGIKKGSLESETVKYGRESHGTRTGKWMRWRGPAAIVNDRPILSSGRMLFKDYGGRCSIEKKILAVSLKGLGANTHWLTVNRQSKATLTDIRAKKTLDRRGPEQSKVKLYQKTSLRLMCCTFAKRITLVITLNIQINRATESAAHNYLLSWKP
jgi:hypothetical protein